MADYERAITLDANYAPAYLGRGMSTRPGSSHRGAGGFQQGDQPRPDNAEAYYNRGLLYQSEKQHQYAIEDFTSASGLTPQQAEPLLGRALSYLALGKAKEAATDLDEAVQADPQNGSLDHPRPRL